MADRVVIMSRGRIEQVGAPQKIYRSPRTRFVAEFLGSSNVFAGRVAEKAGGGILVETPAGTFAVPVAAGARPGEEAIFVVSDDRIQLSGTRPAMQFTNDGAYAVAGNALEATVIAEEFVGATAIVHLEGAGGQELRAQKSHDELARLALSPGARVWMSWSPDASHMLPGR